MILSTQTGEIHYGEPRSRDDSDKVAIAINAASGGSAVAWTQKVVKKYKVPPQALIQIDKEIQ